MQILVDSSVWIEYFTGAPSPEADYLYRLLGKEALVVADVVMAEVLHGLPDEVHRRQAWDALVKFWLVEVGGVNLAWLPPRITTRSRQGESRCAWTSAASPPTASSRVSPSSTPRPGTSRSRSISG